MLQIRSVEASWCQGSSHQVQDREPVQDSENKWVSHQPLPAAPSLQALTLCLFFTISTVWPLGMLLRMAPWDDVENTFWIQQHEDSQNSPKNSCQSRPFIRKPSVEEGREEPVHKPAGLQERVGVAGGGGRGHGWRRTVRAGVGGWWWMWMGKQDCFLFGDEGRWGWGYPQ